MRQLYLPRLMAGGETNPLGARALSWQGGVLHPRHQSTLDHRHLRLLCIRLTNEDVIDLYHRIRVGTCVVVLPGRPPATAAATSLAPLAAMPSRQPGPRRRRP